MTTAITGTNTTYNVNNFTGIVAHTGDVFTITSGNVIFSGIYEGKYTVTVQHNTGECTRYGNLSTISVNVNQWLEAGTKVGTCKHRVEFEYCTVWQGDSLLPVRVYGKEYFKQSPEDILSGIYSILPNVSKTVVTASGDVVELTEAQKKEFLYSRGDNIVEF